MDDEVFPSLDFEPEPPNKRDTCVRCRRPITVCWCPFLPHTPLEVNTKVIILQHPYEDKRGLSTTPMLTYGLQRASCQIIQGPRFNLDRHLLLKDIVDDPNSYLLYPDSDAMSIAELPKGRRYNLVVLDGTWLQARGIYSKNKFLHCMKKVKVDKPPLSKYVVRTQPTDECVSTVESVALALDHLEPGRDLFKILTRPLTALCDFQLDHGAVAHQSKEYLIKNDLYKSQRAKLEMKVESDTSLVSDVT